MFKYFKANHLSPNKDKKCSFQQLFIETKNKMYITNTANLQLHLDVNYKLTFSMSLTTQVYNF